MDRAPQFESGDILGTTVHFNGTVTTTAVAVPPSPAAYISEILIHCPQTANNSSSKELKVSFDGGTNYFTMYRGNSLGWTPKGNLQQVYVKSNSGSVDYEIIMNKEDS